MDIEFHYWMTGLIALRSGFTEDKARKIAYASQYVDGNDVRLEVKSRRDEKDTYENYISQTMNILKPKHELMRIYPIFHFVPGDPMAETARRRDGKMHLLNTTPNGPLANELLDQALAAPDERTWLENAIETHVRGLEDSAYGLLAKLAIFKDDHFWKDGIDRTETDWYRFQESVKEHQAKALVGLAPIFKRMGKDIRNLPHF